MAPFILAAAEICDESDLLISETSGFTDPAIAKCSA
jgi:hypothetical protein